LQFHDPKPFNGQAFWIWTRGGVTVPVHRPDSPYRTAYFRRGFDVADESAALTVHVSADSRYILYLNGEAVARGPAKGDIRHHFYDTVELGERLRPGRNVLAAVVVSYASSWPHPVQLGAPCSVMTVSGAFVLDGELVEAAGVRSLRTDSQWQALADISYGHGAAEGDDQVYAGLCERLDGRTYPRGWQLPDYEDESWEDAAVIAAAVRPDTVTDTPLPYRLIPRTIPQLEEVPERFAAVYAAGRARFGRAGNDAIGSGGPFSIPAEGAGAGSPAEPGFEGARQADFTDGAGLAAVIADGGEAAVQARTRIAFVLDAGTLTTAFPVVRLEGGRDAVIRLTYAEAWTVDGVKSPDHRPDDGQIEGCQDRYTCGGGVQVYEPITWRTFRYVRVDIETADAPLILRGLSYRFTAYPFAEYARFACSGDEHGKIWDLSWRTVRLCAHETYEDCPYYEQLQYAGDTQAVMLYSGYVSGDWRLARQAVRHFDWSRGDDGLTASRYPSRVPQYIPSWSLLWCAMVRDYWFHTGDAQTAIACADGMQAALRWFAKYENGDGLLEALPYWQVVDWVKEWNSPPGYPPGADGGVSGIINLQYAFALRAAAEVTALAERGREDPVGAAVAAAYRIKADRICAKVAEICWFEEEGLFFDKPGGPEVSELGQAWAILAGAASAAQAKRMCAAIGTDRLAKATLYGRHYLFRALSKAGEYGKANGLFDWWRLMAQTDLTTWPEEPWLARSFCHAWSCTPLYEYLAEVLGIKPDAPGFDRVRIEPKPFGLTWAKGHVPTRHGDIGVAWRLEAGEFRVNVALPAGVSGTLRLPDGTETLLEPGEIAASCGGIDL